MRGTSFNLLLCLLLAMLPAAAFSQQQQQGQQGNSQRPKPPSKVYGIHIQGTIKLLRPDMSVIEQREYICERVCYPDEKRFTESYMSWVGEDTDSLQEWVLEFELDGSDFSLTGEDVTGGKGSLEGRAWSWDEISFEYTDADGLLYKFSGDYSGENCQRAGVVTDAQQNVIHFISDESSMITEEEYAMMQAIYHRLKQGYR